MFYLGNITELRIRQRVKDFDSSRLAKVIRELTSPTLFSRVSGSHARFMY